jgi:hypothetical protein
MLVAAAVVALLEDLVVLVAAAVDQEELVLFMLHLEIKIPAVEEEEDLRKEGLHHIFQKLIVVQVVPVS